MNVNFMRLLAERLEHVGRVEVVPEECSFLEFFDSMDGFFMTSDPQYWDRPPGFIFGDDDYFIGSIEDWAAELVQEQKGYFRDYEDEEDRWLNWVDDPIDDEFSEQQVWLLACRALGLGDETDGSAFVVDDGLANALLRPAGLYGRLRGVTPPMAAEVLRRCAGGMPPQNAWALAGQALKESRLNELADVLEKIEAGVPVGKVGDWSHEDLALNLTHFSMQERYWPWTTADGAWCGDISLWAFKLYGATADLSFGAAAPDIVSLASSAFLGLNMVEAVALFEAGVSPLLEDEWDVEAFRRKLAPATASEVLRGVANGVFPSVVWDDIYRRLSLNAFLKEME
ncbi:MAG: hypothetical protein OXC69_04135 [Candidatus Tectomicrobia bacterium]|nr:hypothetical protein [Candidatus Tectomicrobia bacterium]